MAWNEPGGNNQDPWGGRKNNDGPPDLDEALKNFQNKINQLFGGKGGGSKNTSSGSSGFSSGLLIVALLAFLVLYGVSGFYQLDAKEKAIILRLGVYHDTVGPGLHWRPRMIDQVFRVNITEERQYRVTGTMLTEDESIVELPMTVQYNIADIKAFVLSVKEPEISLQQATDSALRHVVGSSQLNLVLAGGREKIAVEVLERLRTYLDSYQTGINVIGVNIQKGEPPAQVKAAFDDVIKAKEDENRLINQAQAYSNEVIPEARGKAQRILEEANGYREQVVAKAEGEADRFNQLLIEYQKAPDVTRERLYIDAVETVMSNSSKIMVDVEGGNNMMYLPLDKIIAQGNLSRVSEGEIPPEVLRQITEQVTEEITRNVINNSRRGVR
ncbi:MAG: FtsH protease activity modulator HflK [Cellvibrionaceae bacterium]|nr:FtsH protease activity modulator HflK [Cellvibrionaceae bacterium]